jgi:hypothetical protein
MVKVKNIIMLKNNPHLKEVCPVGQQKINNWNDSQDESLKQDIVDFLNKHLPEMWDDDPFEGKVDSEGLYDALIIEYNNLKHFFVDSDKYRICVSMYIVGDQACLFED